MFLVVCVGFFTECLRKSENVLRDSFAGVIAECLRCKKKGCGIGSPAVIPQPRREFHRLSAYPCESCAVIVPLGRLSDGG